ncbi:MAG: RecX family transcriptional regulator [Tannerellaceae bacterium]|jgi:regulatory protein|nr:RecX family transcriptional regulator [Tannerellaceae bacterium]
MKEIDEGGMMSRMAAYCSAAERCVFDVEKKIAAAGLSKESSERITAFLLKERYIDHERFARCFVSDKLRFNRWGRIRLEYELRARRIPPEICRAAIEGINEEEYMSILSSELEKKMKKVGGKEAFGRLLRFAAGRGFESGETTACLRELLEANP